jgi:hypothetical protein
MVIARRKRTQAPPPQVIWSDLSDPHRSAVRPWLILAAGEIEPRIVEAVEPHLVVWSSLWPHRPDDLIRFDVTADRGGSMVQWTLSSPAEEPDPTKVRALRQRINVLINDRLRQTYDQ